MKMHEAPDALLNQSALAYRANPLRCAAGRCAGCTARAVAHQLALPMALGYMVNGRKLQSKTGAP